MIVTGEIGGAMWKGKIDCLNLEEKYFVDIKTTKDMHEKKWDERLNRKANFIERFGYVLQMAVYCELLRQQYDKNFLPLIAAVSKQTPSEAKLITLSEEKMIYELEELKENIEHIVRVKMVRKHQLVVEFVNIVEDTTKLQILPVWTIYRRCITNEYWIYKIVSKSD